MFLHNLKYVSFMVNGNNKNQQSHGAHSLPEKTIHINLFIISLINRRKKPITYLIRIERFFILTNLNPPYQRMLYAKFI